MKKEDVLQLLPILNERSISKGELDVVYTEYQNWSRHGLLIDGLKHKKGQQSKLSMKEYLWLRIVDKLIRFGVNYNSIIEIKSKVFAPIEPELIFVAIEKEDSEFAIDYPEEYELVTQALNNESEYRENMKAEFQEVFSSFELILISIISSGLDVKILVSESGANEIIMENIELENDDIERVKSILCSAHIVIPFSELISKYLDLDNFDCCNPVFSPLTKEEHQLIKLIRGVRFKNLKSVEVSYKDGVADKLLVSELKKKVKVESRLLDHLQKGTYQNITFKTQDDNIVSFVNTRKYKL